MLRPQQNEHEEAPVEDFKAQMIRLVIAIDANDAAAIKREAEAARMMTDCAEDAAVAFRAMRKAEAKLKENWTPNKCEAFVFWQTEAIARWDDIPATEMEADDE